MTIQQQNEAEYQVLELVLNKKLAEFCFQSLLLIILTATY